MILTDPPYGKSFKSCPREGASKSRTPELDWICVSSHAPVRGHPVLLILAKLSLTASFKSCPREGASIYNLIKDNTCHSVSSHAPVRGHLNIIKMVGLFIGFKSCPREGASSYIFMIMYHLFMFQVMPP